MKKLSKKFKRHLVSKIKKKHKRFVKLANLRKFTQFTYNQRMRRFNEVIERRKRIIKLHYKKFYLKNKVQKVSIDGEFGIENPNSIDSTLDIASRIIDFNTETLKIDLINCTRVWPSGVTLLCSLLHWVELSAIGRIIPKIYSSNSNIAKVNSYLDHCGFYKYVKRVRDFEIDNYYNDQEIVKIERETDQSSRATEKRENQILELLKNYSNFTDEEIEIFDTVILTEILINVSEHGIVHKDKGWWVLAQFHKNHNIISICIADNGIGFRNSLMTGPQSEEISKIIANDKSNDGKFIKLCFEREYSGAFDEPVPKRGFLKKTSKPGEKRGLGLKRIKNACQFLGIRFNILSQHGYIIVDEKGKIEQFGAKSNRIFAGTLYQLNIKVGNKNL